MAGHLLRFAALLLIGPAVRAAEPSAVVLWYAQPAAKWEEALPVGNGHVGAMVFGGAADERIQFNEATLWTGRPHDYVREGAGEQLAEIRRLIAAGEIEPAHRLVRAKFLSDPVRQKAYQPFGDLRLHFAGHENPAEYRRELDLDAAVARVSYKVDGVSYRREVFASYPARVLLLRVTADQPGKISVSLRMDSPHKSSAVRAMAPDQLALTGQVQADGLRFESRLRVLSSGGRVAVTDDGIKVEGADAVTFMLAASTSFKNFQDITAEPGERCAETLARVDGKNFETLLAAHLADHRALFRRVAFNLGRSPRADLPTDERVKRVRAAGDLAGDPSLTALLFQYGRYLLIASSRPGGQPANLQGIWNELLAPPWESKFTTNINFEMNYWLAELTNLSECHEPFFDLVDDAVVSGHRTARAQYGANGWVLHHNTDLWRGTAPINNIDGMWPTGGAWLAHHFWERYLFSGDREFLARRAYPVMKGASEFFVDFLVKDAKTGWLVTSPSHSPEQGPLNAGPTMDNQLIRALFNHTIEAAGILGIDADFARKLAATCALLPPNQIGKHGQLQEWLDDVDVPNNAHRHMSPLWALYPGADITPADPQLFAATKKLLTWRGDGSTGWSYVWRIPLWARVGDGEFAYRQLTELVRRKILPNLFDLCGPFQIDGNFGAPAGIAEMLLQSHLTTPNPAGGRMPQIDLLPALPKAWPAGSIEGLRARGGFEIDLAWQNSALTRVVLRSQLGAPCRMRVGEQTVDLALAKGGAVALTRDSSGKLTQESVAR
ncbi:MAG TPA: glycoside hydrolase family 95 protein [Opitutaceae bacterium]|nr:glycoside hydrolase family 95 protein [Opitutaceae bacterium]